MKNKKKKSGSIAVPYLVTIFIGIIIVGGSTLLLLNHFGILGMGNELSEPPQRNVVTATYADNHTILFILDEPDLNTNSTVTFLLMRSVPKDKKLVFVGIPSNMIAIIGENQQSILSAYKSDGAPGAAKFTEDVFKIKVDRYMRLQSGALIKICDILGGVTYPISEDILGFNGDGSSQYLNSEQVEKLITYSLYGDGEIERAYVVGSVFSSMVNQSSGPRLADNFDSSFNTIVNMTDTNITAVDYNNHKTAIKNMLLYGSSIASFLIVNGEKAYDDFIPDEGFFEDFREKYYSYDEEVKEK